LIIPLLYCPAETLEFSMPPHHLAENTAATALVLGATGGIGGEVAHTLLAHGWQVRALSRQPAQAKPAPNGSDP
jgi:hypothetical protein